MDSYKITLLFYQSSWFILIRLIYFLNIMIQQQHLWIHLQCLCILIQGTVFLFILYWCFHSFSCDEWRTSGNSFIIIMNLNVNRFRSLCPLLPRGEIKSTLRISGLCESSPKNVGIQKFQTLLILWMGVCPDHVTQEFSGFVLVPSGIQQY